MGLYEFNAEFCVDTDEEGNSRLRNTTPTDDLKSQFVKLNEFPRQSLNFDVSNITVLQITNCDITEIPNSIRQLNLKQLIISRTKLKEIPSCLYSGLESIEFLDFSHNCIKFFQIEPACSSILVKLNLCNNRMEDFPDWVLTARCPNLQEVNYSKNHVQKLATSRNLNIKKLEMCSSELMDEDYYFLKRIKTLEFLDISNDKSYSFENRFKDINELFVGFRWKNLLSLKLNNLMLSIVPKAIFSIISLNELNLVNCELNWIPDEIQYLKNLKVLDVSENGICLLPKCLTFLENLSVVKAAFNYISSVEEFYSELEILDLYNNQLNRFESHLPRIRYIDLEQNIFDTTHLKHREYYEQSRDEFRAMSTLQRVIGPLEPSEEPSESSEESPDSEEYELSDDSENEFNDDSVKCYVNAENECWDYEESTNVKLERNPEITPSDDEWDGDEDTKIKKMPRNSLQFDANEDWIFADADEMFS